MVDVLVILDGASEPLGDAPTSLERARTPVLDRLASEGTVTLLRTVPPGLPPGSESAIPALLGWVPDAPVDRGAVAAAAHHIEVGADEPAWRVDRRDRADASAIARQLAEWLPQHRVYHLDGHRMLVVGAGRPPSLGGELFAWPAGAIPPRVLDEDTVVIGARGAAVGIARLMGARTIVPLGATGRPGTNLAAKAAAALAAIGGGDSGGGRVAGGGGRTRITGGGGARRIVVHVGAPDEAAHERDANAKVAAIEAADALLLAPLADALRARGGTLRVCPDHGCDPATGEHVDAPVPCLDWTAADATVERPGGLPTARRLTERAAARPASEPASESTSAPAVTAARTVAA
ncbi:MAG: hypothetical protein ACLP1Q_14235 [Solirubrobacteraceae bacterium]